MAAIGLIQNLFETPFELCWIKFLTETTPSACDKCIRVRRGASNLGGTAMYIVPTFLLGRFFYIK